MRESGVQRCGAKLGDKIRILLLIGVFLGIAGCAPQSAMGPETSPAALGDEDDDLSKRPQERAEVSQPVLPNVDLTEATLYEFLLAEIAAQRGNVGLSAQAYADIAKRTRDPRIARRATEIALLARMSNVALDAARIWVETEPQSQRATQILAGLLVGAGFLDEALPHLQRALEAPGANPAEVFQQLPRTLANVRDKSASLALTERLAARYPTLAQARLAVAQAAFAADRDELALKEIRQVQDMRPDWEPAVIFEAQVLQRTSSAEAVARLARHLQRYPNSREVRLNYARALVTAKRENEARAEFQKLLSDFPNNVELVYAVAFLALQANDLQTADTNLRRLLELDYRDKNSVRMYLGQIAEDRKRLDDALKWYGDIDDGAQYVPAQVRYAQVLARQGKIKEAQAHLQKVAERDVTQRVPMVLAQAQLLREANQSKAAFSLLEEELKSRPDNIELLYDYAMLAERLDRMDLMESSLRRVIAARPDHAHAFNALGYSLADRNIRLPEARELIETALKLAPKDFFIVDSMGWVLYRMGMHGEAAKYLREAYAGRPDGEIAAHLGEVLWVMGDREAARKIWREAVEKFPTNETLTNTLKRFSIQ
jgi:tetratricopeptide (TPR) repeat protein